MAQSTNCILMVRPASFRSNEETAVNNYFQDTDAVDKNTNFLAQAEFDNAVKTLQLEGVQVIVLEDSGKYDTPDSIFPNNIISFHGDKAILYPMFAHNRQREIFLNHLGVLEKNDIHFKTLKDYSIYTEQEIYLEGTGVLILDRENKIAYCSISERANQELLSIFCEDNQYKPVVFHATQNLGEERLPIYHTNVMMALGTNFSVICLDTIQDNEEKQTVIESLTSTNKTIIPISEHQMNHFCGNILELKDKDRNIIIVMSEQAHKAFSDEQIDQLENFGRIVQIPLYTIEKYGGGSMRCMIAEVFHQ
ncbi:citrulline utilization hydrolase CtlX [Sphingobacterium bovistauri]|uniref:Amidinotransferase n=1 Tax=Sphingobacterium bovistauri TaxID=2781959 RepID=A0ABS7ZAH6_9SPHI|nr:arginine deiminase-related protein [Sphingobacterium bovistauri]MCA5006587.1 amidinotransferase [Sphingobacterium bovistauri]